MATDKRKMIDDDEDDMEIVELESENDDDDNELNDDAEDGDDDRLSSDQRDAQDDGSDGDETSSRAVRRKRQKERQREKIKKTREENAVLIRELQAAKERLAALETRNIQVDAQTAEQKHQFALAQIHRAEAELKEAFETGDGDKAVKAQRLREMNLQAAREAEELKKRLTNPPAPEKTSVLDPLAEDNAKRWMRKNPWFDPAGSDEDSAIARAIDEAWAREASLQGISPSSEDYWDELDTRVRRRLGKESAAGRKRERSAPPISGRGEYAPRPSTGDNNKVYVTPERKQALIQAGVWDDPEKRKRYIKRFQEYDKQNPRRAS
jgi:hypothetical protein